MSNWRDFFMGPGNSPPPDPKKQAEMEDRITDALERQTCPSCGKSEPEVTFDADTFTLDCDECIGFRFAFSRAYEEQRKRERRGY